MSKLARLFERRWPPGYHRISAFFADVEGGKVAKTESVVWLEEALRKIVNTDPSTAAVALELKWKKGQRQPPSADAFFEKWGKVFSFIYEELNREDGKRGAKGRAFDSAAKKFRKERTVIEKAWYLGAQNVFVAIAEAARANKDFLESLTADELKYCEQTLVDEPEVAGSESLLKEVRAEVRRRAGTGTAKR